MYHPAGGALTSDWFIHPAESALTSDWSLHPVGRALTSDWFIHHAGRALTSDCSYTLQEELSLLTGPIELYMRKFNQGFLSKAIQTFVYNFQ